jgi:hypothetical protein
VIPRPARRRRLHPAALGIGLGVVGSAIVAGGLVLARADGPDAHRRATTHPAASAISLAPSSSPAQTSTSSARGSVRAAPDRSSAASAKHPPRQVETGSPAPVRPTPPATAFWLSALKRIDDLRARAFATRNPTLLRDVYSAPALASADVAQLRRLVPPGCLLPGVRSTYRDVTVHPSGDRASVQVAATLPPTELHCHGKVRATLPGAGPTRLELVLLRTRAGVRIAEQRLG